MKIKQFLSEKFGFHTFPLTSQYAVLRALNMRSSLSSFFFFLNNNNYNNYNNNKVFWAPLEDAMCLYYYIERIN